MNVRRQSRHVATWDCLFWRPGPMVGVLQFDDYTSEMCWFDRHRRTRPQAAFFVYAAVAKRLVWTRGATRAYHPGYYAAFVLDANGNNIEAVYHGEANRSAPSVHITF